MENEVFYCIRHQLVKNLRQLLHEDNEGSFVHLNLLSEAIGREELDVTLTKARKDILQIILDYERSFRSESDFGHIAHECLVTAARQQDAAAIDILLLAGCDLFYEVDDRNTVYDIMMVNANDDVAEINDLYFPGIWNAVATQNLDEVRRLVSLWCCTDIAVNGRSLTQLAHSTGNEVIIKLIDGSFHTLQLIHAVFAGNVLKVKKLLTDHKKSIRLDFRRFHPLGPVILFYVIRRNEFEIASILVNNGCKLYSFMEFLDHTGPEMPVLYEAIRNPDLDLQMLHALLPSSRDQQKLLYLMLFQKDSLLEAAMKSRLNLACFKILVERSGARLVADRNSKCHTARDVANASPDLKMYVDVIDNYVIECIQRPRVYPGQRQILALHGYDLSQVAFHEKPTDRFLSLFGDYQSQIKALFRAIENDDTQTFINLSEWKREDQKEDENKKQEEKGDGLKETMFLRHLTWEGREGGTNPLPLLHRSIIFNRESMTKTILELKPMTESVDFLLDHHRRTALHYASSLASFSEARTLLLKYGASDSTRDREIASVSKTIFVNKIQDGIQAADFLKVQDLPSTHRLIQRLRFADLDKDEPDPWKEKQAANSDDEDNDEDDDDDDSENGSEKNGLLKVVRKQEEDEEDETGLSFPCVIS